ncbi:haloacid dehalogenase superfamily, subfamily IA, variant 3 with third motif having DD or ED/haloacid dehalogenase superfamily, subfamily IA, variant 1 with third motif having Dx(3-4)D or Dx(3-4)E/beta-phosphoglucomutase family hydrolase [Mucilaginibacter mallensis]|uniref:Beta-phosphoglucomutase n=1 Tax=Mucilaginibacter mallensis TaxID=652787 RepID=A0A1H2ARK7_MUCMA|nr:haloacid dehalogenase superfamily, subfamily IA, variant 3 with third motif having DD or ED/haloacid dehalogenase superfamily, subfamily IA, variant 1 with third motif having Dx(3-4)D or Dx(3-4)E/beta-phosphoglucomutase family hydrolase [Mucilaginibacter mallensis]
MKNFTAIFDMDGTLIDNTPYHFKSWQALFKKHDLGTLTLETYRTEISGVPIIETLRRLFGDKYDEAGLHQLLEEKESYYREIYAPFLAPINGLENFLTALKDAGIKMAIASSATMEDIEFILNKIPIRDDFEAIIDGSRVSKGKPNPQIFLKAAEELKARPEDCVVFEDSLAGIKAANAAGMKVVGITTGHTADQLQPSGLVINDYTELTVQKLAALFI